MTLTFELNLDVFQLDIHAKIPSLHVHPFGWDCETDIQTDTQCQNYYTRHVRDVGCNKYTP